MLSILKKVTPPAVKNRVRAFIDDHTRRDRTAQLKRIPRVDLGAEHVANLVGLPNREAMVALMPRDAVAAEIGVNVGKFSRVIKDVNAPRRLHLIDAWDYNPSYKNKRDKVTAMFADDIASGSVVITEGYSTVVAPSFADGYFDWIYIDTDHSYETTRDELIAYEPKMKPGGVIAGHDYAMGNWRSGVKYGVIEAVHEFCVGHGWELIYVTTELSNHPSFAIRKLGAGGA